MDEDAADSHLTLLRPKKRWGPDLYDFQAQSPLDLLGLPDSWMMNMMSFLNIQEQLAMFQTSRACAIVVLNYYAEAKATPTCTVSKSTAWKGFRQVLSWIQTPISLRFKPPSDRPAFCRGISAYNVLLGSTSTPKSLQQAICDKWSFPCVKEVDVVGCKICSLVPRVIAATCPNLQTCCTSVAGLISGLPVEELYPCHKLQNLTIYDDHSLSLALSQMPDIPYHSRAELHTAFPTVVWIYFTGAVVPFVMQAFSNQLSGLDVHITRDTEALLLQPYSTLEYLTLRGCFVVNNLLPLPVITDHLDCLKLPEAEITDSIFQQLLQLPQLRQLAVRSLNDLELDYSSHSFKNSISLTMFGAVQQLRVFAKLPIGSFKQCWLNSPALEVHLPDPSEDGSLAAVQKVSEAVASAGIQIGTKFDVNWVVPQTANDADAASLFSIAARAVRPCQECDVSAVANRPELLKAILSWAAPTVESVHFQLTPEASKPYIWQTLQQAPFVSLVTLSNEPGSLVPYGGKKLLGQVCDVICSAANHLVKLTFKPGDTITFVTAVGRPRYTYVRHIDMIQEIMDESLPVNVLCNQIEVFDAEWELTLEMQATTQQLINAANT